MNSQSDAGATHRKAQEQHKHTMLPHAQTLPLSLSLPPVLCFANVVPNAEKNTATYHETRIKTLFDCCFCDMHISVAYTGGEQRNYKVHLCASLTPFSFRTIATISQPGKDCSICLNLPSCPSGTTSKVHCGLATMPAAIHDTRKSLQIWRIAELFGTPAGSCAAQLDG